MTEVKTFRAASMQAALDIVRQEMGGDAVILHTRQIESKRLLPWRKPRREVEITAGLGVQVRPVAGLRESRAAAPAAAQPSLPTATLQQTPHKPRIEASPPPGPPLRPAFHESQLSTELRSHRDRDVAERHTPPSRPQFGGSPRTVPQPASAPETNLAAKLESIQKMLEELGRSGKISHDDEVPNELFHIYTDLIEAEVDDDLARELVAQLKKNCSTAQLQDAAAAKALLAAMVESEMRCGSPIVPTPGRRKVVGLIGATGVGKTTTIAKLAANFRLREGIRMGLVTVDTYRIAAVEQLRTYAEIIDLPMKVVTSPPEMRRALDELMGLDLVLIDTAGRSPRDDLKIQELKSLLNEADVDEVHLVMSLTSSLKSLTTTAEKFQAASPTSVILTKLDEAPSMGSLLSLARNIPLPVSYLTTGQNVPDDIETAHAGRMSRLILGQEQLSI